MKQPILLGAAFASVLMIACEPSESDIRDIVR